MKKTLAIILVILFGIALLTGCNSLSGRYTLISMDLDGEDITELFSILGIDINDIYLEFTSDGKFVMDMSAIYSGRTEGTYTVSGNTLTLTSNGDDVIAIIQGSKIIIDDDDSQAIFEKR